jgi:rod shape-determining protein MreC
MFGSRKIVFYILIGCALLSPCIFFSSPLRPWETNRTLPLALQEITFPIARGWHATTSYFSEVWRTYFDLRNAARENIALKAKLNLMQVRILDYDEQVQQTSRLRKLLGFAQYYDRKLVVAEVVGGKSTHAFKTLRVARGTSDGVRIGMPVVAADGVVGRVVRASKGIADVQLLVDFDFNIDVLLQRTRVRGVLSGYAGDNCRLNVQKGTEVRIGDTITTSGIVGGFPKGLPVGRVMRISYESDNVSQVITVEPWVDYRRLEEVMILYETDPELQKIFETAGPEWFEKTASNIHVGG